MLIRRKRIQTNVLNEGGNAIKSSQPIRGDLTMGITNQVVGVLKQKYPNLVSAPLGSTGKKTGSQTSGDIDIALQLDYDKEAANIESFLKSKYQNMETRYLKGFHILSVGFPYLDGNTTKIAQCDLMFFPNIELAKYFYYSPDFTKNQSKFKGSVRNMLMQNILKNIPVQGMSNTTFENGNAKDIYKYNLQPDKGLVVLHQTFEGKKGQERKSKSTVKDDTKVVMTDPKQITRFMMGNKASDDTISSLEKMVDWMNGPNFPYRNSNEQIFKDFLDYVEHQEPQSLESVRSFIESKKNVSESKRQRKSLRSLIKESFVHQTEEVTEDDIKREVEGCVITYKTEKSEPIKGRFTLFTDFETHTYNPETKTGVIVCGTPITNIPPYMFFNSVISEIIIPNTVEVIYSYAFNQCRKLQKLVIPDSVKKIEEGAFERCIHLKEVVLPENVEIGNLAFKDNYDLRKIYIPKSVKYDKKNGKTFLQSPVNVQLFRGKRGLIVVDERNQLLPESRLVESFVHQTEDATEQDALDSYESKMKERIIFFKTKDHKPIRIWDKDSSLPKLIISNTYDKKTDTGMLLFKEPVTSIGAHAFEYHAKLTSITIPSSVTSIGRYAFDHCTSLESVTIPEGVESIGDDAFAGCSSLTSVAIPSSVKSIGWSAFSGCLSLTSITIPEGVKSIGDYAFRFCSLASVTIPSSVTSIGNYAFAQCYSLETISIPNSVLSMGLRPFEGCAIKKDRIVNHSRYILDGKEGLSICDVEQTDGLMIKGDKVVRCRPWAVSVIVPEGVTKIGKDAFHSCHNITSISIPKSIKTFPNLPKNICHLYKYDGKKFTSVFELRKAIKAHNSLSESFVHQTEETTEQDTLDSYSLKNRIIFYKTKDQKPISLWYFSWDGKRKSDIPKLIESNTYDEKSDTGMLLFKEPVTSIGDDAFRCCFLLTSITIPESVKSIGDKAFFECINLASIDIPEGVTSIGSSAFNSCALTSVTIPEGVKSIRFGAFADCPLTSITIPESVKSIESDAFYFHEKSKLEKVFYKGIEYKDSQSIKKALANSQVSLGYNIFYFSKL